MSLEQTNSGLRSPTLRPYVDWIDTRWTVVRRRWLIVGGALIAAAVPALLVWRRALPTESGYALYWLHDNVLLPFIGYTYSLHYPYSFVWWIPALAAAAVWLVTVLTRWSAVRRPHVRLCTRVIEARIAASARSASNVRLLAGLVEWLRRRGLGCELLRHVARLAHTEALRVVVEKSTTSLTPGVRLVRLTNLVASLEAGTGVQADVWQALVTWHQCLRCIDLAYDDQRDLAPFGELRAELMAVLPRLIDKLEPAARVETTFTGRLTIDLARLGDNAAGSGDGKGLAGAVASIATRLGEIRTILDHVGSDWRRRGEPVTPPSAVEGPACEALGVLSLSLGLHAALRIDDASLALAHVNAFDALRFAARCAPDGSAAVAFAREFAAEAPQREHYRFCRDVAARARERLHSTGLSGTTLAQALGNEDTLLETLNDAAGPDFADSGIVAGQRVNEAAATWRARGRDALHAMLHRIRRRPIPLRRRTDPILIGGWLFAVCVTTLALWGVFSVLEDRFPAWTERPLPDYRILHNIRRDLSGKPVLDAVLHPPDREIVVSSSGGTMHSLDPATGLWSTDRPFTSGLANPDVRWLTSTSGNGGAVWGVTADGGLVRRQNRRWEIVVSDSRFSGRDKKPVQHGELTVVAVSERGEWLAAGTRSNGVGIYDLARRRWVPVPAHGMPAAIRHAAWWKDRFWLGSTDGLTELVIRAGSAVFQPRPDFTGDVLDLDVHPQHGLWALQKGLCANGGNHCLRLSRLDEPSGRAAALIDQRNHFARLSLDRLFHAAEWEGRLVLAGHDGVFAYDPRVRSWRQLAADAVTVIEPCDAQPCFYFGHNQGVGLVTPKTLAGEPVARWALPGERPVRIANGGTTGTIVLTESGKAFEAVLNRGATPIFSPTTSTAFSRFDHAVAFGDSVLFFGASGALWHDTSSRSYTPLPSFPSWLRSPDAIVRTSSTHLYALTPVGTSYAPSMLSALQIASGVFMTAPSDNAQIPGPIRFVDNADVRGLRVIDGAGRVASITSLGVSYLTGSRGDAAGALVDVTGSDEMMAVTTTNGVRRYSGRTRSWWDVLAATAGEHPVEVAIRGPNLYARSRNDRLVTLGVMAAVAIGGGRFLMPDEAVTDVLPVGTDLYVAGAGAIDRYNTRARGIDRTWQVDADSRARVSVESVIEREPLSLAAGVVRLGSRELARDVARLSVDGTHLWLVKDAAGRRYLEHAQIVNVRPAPARGSASVGGAQSPIRHALAEQSCFFRSPTAGEAVGEIRDVRPQSRDLVAVATNAGLRFYNRTRRTWYATDLAPEIGTGDLYALGGVLVAADPEGPRQRVSVFRSPPALPGSCDDGPIRFSTSPTSVSVQSFTVDEKGGRAVALQTDGAVIDITPAETRPLLPPAAEGPPGEEIVRSWHFADVASQALWVATRDRVWRYDLPGRTWTPATIVLEGIGALTPDTSIDLQPSAGSLGIVARRASGEFFTGVLPGDRGAIEAGPVRLQPVMAAGRPFFDAPADRILDVQRDGDSWTFVLNDRMRVFDARTRAWRTPMAVAGTDRIVSRGRLGSTEVMTGTTGTRDVWWVRVDGRDQASYARYEHRPGETTVLAGRDRIYSLDANAVLRGCELNVRSEWRCDTERPPLRLSPDAVRRALAWRRHTDGPYDLILFETDTGLVAYSPRTGTPVSLGPSSPMLPPISALRELKGRLWVRAGGAVLSLDALVGSADADAQITQGVLDVVADDQQNTWARFNDGWRIWDARSRQFVRAAGGNSRLRILAAEGARTTALDAGGTPHLLSGDRFVPAAWALPREIPAREVEALLPRARDDWWVAWGSSLAHLASVPCAPGPGQRARQCSAIVERRDLASPSAGAVMDFGTDPGDINIRTTSGARFRSTRGRPLQAIGEPPPPATPLADRRGELRPWFSQVNGQWVFDRFTGLHVSGESVVARRASGEMWLGSGGGSVPEPGPALDIGWLRWDRSEGAFVVSTPAGPRRYSTQQFAPGGRLLFEGVDALRAGTNRSQVANAAGVWELAPDLGLNTREVRFHPMTWTHPPTMHGGWFRSGAFEYAAVGGELERRAASGTFRIGSALFFKDVRDGLLAVIQRLDGRLLSGYSGRRFVWDSGRRAVTFGGALDGSADRRGLLLLSDAGLHDASAPRHFDPGPPGTPGTDDRLGMGPDGQPRFFRNGAWYRRAAPGVWEPVPALAPEQAGGDGTWKWTKRNGRLTVEDVSRAETLTTVAGTGEFGFASDVLIDMVAAHGRLFVATRDAVIVTTPDYAQAPAKAATRVAAAGIERLELLRLPEGPQLFLTRAGSISRWHPASERFVPVTDDENPYRRRIVQAGPLRFVFASGSVEKYLLLENPSRTLPFRFENGRFPFDVVTSVAASNDALLVGTAVGLQRYVGHDLSLETAHFVELERSGAGRSGPVVALGRPCGAPETMVACRADACFQQSGSGEFSPMGRPDALACRVRMRSPMWSWTERDGRLEGRYELVDASPGSGLAASAASVDFRDGRFPHDDISQVAAFGATLATVWRGNRVSVHGGNGLDATGVRQYVFAEPVRLVAIARPVPLVDRTEADLPSGMYVREGPRLWRLVTDGWSLVGDRSEIATLDSLERDRPILQRRRLRLVRSRSAGGLAFEMRMPGRTWEPIPWDASANRLSIDVWQHLRLAAGALWVATPRGLVTYAANGRFDPDSFRFVDAVPHEAGRDVTELRVAGAEATVRYDADSSRVYTLQLSEGGQATGFARLSGRDPFAEQHFDTDARYWTWSMVGRVGRSLGRLTGAWKNEPVRFDNGRFDFDTVSSMAFFGGRLNFATSSRGWFEAPVSSVALADVSRPRRREGLDPVAISSVHTDGETSAPTLCLATAGEFVRLTDRGAIERTRGCPTLLGRAGFWRYVRDGTKLQVVPAVRSSRPGERLLKDGRFADDVVVGPPVERTTPHQVLLPTAAGIMQLDGRLDWVDMFAPPFAGATATPRALHVSADGKVLYAGGGRFHAVSGAAAPADSWPLKLPPGIEPDRIEAGPDRLVQVEWSDANGRHHDIIDPERPSAQARDVHAFDGRGLRAFRRSPRTRYADGWIRVAVRPGAATDPRAVPIEAAPGFQPLEWMRWGRFAVVVGRQDVIELNLERVARK